MVGRDPQKSKVYSLPTMQDQSGPDQRGLREEGRPAVLCTADLADHTGQLDKVLLGEQLLRAFAAVGGKSFWTLWIRKGLQAFACGSSWIFAWRPALQ